MLGRAGRDFDQILAFVGVGQNLSLLPQRAQESEKEAALLHVAGRGCRLWQCKAMIVSKSAEAAVSTLPSQNHVSNNILTHPKMRIIYFACTLYISTRITHLFKFRLQRYNDVHWLLCNGCPPRSFCGFHSRPHLAGRNTQGA